MKTVRGNPCAVEIFGILSDHALKSVGQLELAPERVYELGLATKTPSWQGYDEGEGDEDTISELSVQTAFPDQRKSILLLRFGREKSPHFVL